MASQKYANLAQSILASGYTAGNTTITVSTGDGSFFPSAGDFIVAMDDPPAFFLKCTSRTGDVLTVSATGQEGSTAANKSSGTKVTQVLTAGALDDLRIDLNGIGTYASLPATGMKQGDTWHATNSPYFFVYDGSAWQPFLVGSELTLPLTSGWNWDTQGSSTVDTTNGNLYLSFQATGADSLRAYYRAVSGPFTMILQCRIALWHDTSPQAGGGLLIGDGTKYLVFGPYDFLGQGIPAPRIRIQYWSDRTTAVSNLLDISALGAGAIGGGSPIWMKCVVDSTNVTFYMSMDGLHWIQMYQEAKGAHLGTIVRAGVGGYLHTAFDQDVLSVSGI